MNYKKINNIIGWAVCLFACAIYLITKEKTVSFWDCGEFIAGAAKLEVVHSPGAPLFLMIGRMFVAVLGMKNAALAINSLSALSSGFTILFLFWTITHFAKRILVGKHQELTDTITTKIMIAGVVGALAYTFSDTFWFSAVEGEVYAMSSLLTAIVFWAILKWEDSLDNINERYADRWILLIAFIMGLSVGVHLLNLLTIPAIVMVYYFKKYEVSTWGMIKAFLLGCVITGFIQFGVIQTIPYLASRFDITFINSFGLPFNSGVLFFFILIVIAVFFLLKWAKSKGHYFVHLGTLSFIFIMIGISSFLQTIIRSNVEVPIDMTNPDNAISLIKYLQREQYGKVPLFRGPDFSSKPNGMKDGHMEYWKGKEKYEELGMKQDEYEYGNDQMRLFPRVWDNNDPNHVNYYKQYLNLAEGETPSSGDNLGFFMGYQVNMMWWRYFCWNFIGRQNDYQQIMHDPNHGNFITGINGIDKMMGRGDMSKMPEAYKTNRANNALYGLPFILGLLGIIYQYRKDKKNAFIVGLLFFFTGLAIVLYLNNTPMQPRERDYAYVGCMYAFAIWIGLGVLMVMDLFKKFMGDGKMTAYAAGLLCTLAVPVLMASKEWDDHDRSDKTLAIAAAHNYLNSCEPNAILFTEGDNDTYPLWYAQEVDGFRNDVRIVNISLLGIDWYIDQLHNAANKNAPVDMVWKSEDYRGDKRNYIQYLDNKTIPQDKFVNLKEVMQFMCSNDPGAQATANNGETTNYLPVKNLFIPIDKELVKKNNLLLANDTSALADQLQFTLSKNTLFKNDLAILNIVAANAWKRPIYFCNSIDPDHYENLSEYLQLEGLAYKLVPVRTPGSTANAPLRVNIDKCMDLMMNKFEFGNAEKGTVHYDQPNKRMLNNSRILAFQLADYLSRNNRKEDALKVLDKVTKMIHERSYPTMLTNEERTSLLMADSYIKAGGKKQAADIVNKLIKFSEDNVNYMSTLSEEAKGKILGDCQFSLSGLNFLSNEAKTNGMEDIAKTINDKLQVLMQKVPQGQN
jgi:hypothetical protein